MNTRLAEAFPAGEFLADELEARGWTQAEFAEILDRPAQFVSEIISGKKEITRESAVQIAAALGTSPEYWLNLQNAYLLWEQQNDSGVQRQLEEVRLRARLQELAPISLLERRGLIPVGDPVGQLQALKELFDVQDIFDEPQLLMAARRANAQEPVMNTQLAWAAFVRRQADAIEAGPYSAKGVAAIASQVTTMARVPEGVLDLPPAFASVGVRLVYLEAFPSSKIDGCSLKHADGGPIIGVSGRGKRLDKVLFTILHEAGHIHSGHLEKEPYIIDDQAHGPALGPEQEQAADHAAAEWVLPRVLPRVPQRVTSQWIEAEAGEMGIHPIVLIGQLQKAGRLPWRTTLVRDAPSATDYLAAW